MQQVIVSKHVTVEEFRNDLPKIIGDVARAENKAVVSVSMLPANSEVGEPGVAILVVLQ